jgi:hypothetical protein
MRAEKASSKPKSFPLVHDHWEATLKGYPNTLDVLLFLDSLRNGVCAYYDGQRTQPVVSPNYHLTPDEWLLLTSAHDKEIELGHNIGYFSELPFPNAHVHPLGLTDKKENGRKTGDRPLIDPKSVNNHTTKIYCPSTSWDEHLEMIHLAGRGGYIAKEDLVSAFQNFYYREQDQFLFCFFIPGKGYGYSKALNFGARVNPPIYDRLSRLASWVFTRKCYALNNNHHVDDHLFFFNALSTLSRPTPTQVMDNVHSTSKHLGIVLSDKKRHQPNHKAVVVGIVVDLTSFTLSITPERKQNILADLSRVLSLSVTTKHDIEILLGSLTFISKVAPAIRPLLNRMTHAATAATYQHMRNTNLPWDQIHSRSVRVTLTKSLHADIALIHSFTTSWSGTAPVLAHTWQPSLTTYLATSTTGADACLTGFAGVYGKEWFADTWTQAELQSAQRKKRVSMPYLELLAQRYVVATWKDAWKGERILLGCDCEPAVNAINNGLSPDPSMAELIRSIAVDAMSASCDVKAIWIKGTTNEPADSLSRFTITLSQLERTYNLLGKHRVHPKGRLQAPARVQPTLSSPACPLSSHSPLAPTPRLHSPTLSSRTPPRALPFTPLPTQATKHTRPESAHGSASATSSHSEPQIRRQSKSAIL